MFATRIQSHFDESQRTKQKMVQSSLPVIVRAAEMLVAALGDGKRVLACGNGGSAGDAQHFSAELTGRFERERRPLPGIALSTDTSALTAIGNDYGYDFVFSRQVEALGGSGDILVAISTSGNSSNVLKAMDVAHRIGMRVIALTGRDGGKMASVLRPVDCELRVPSKVTARIQETHILLLHCLCDAVDEGLFPASERN